VNEDMQDRPTELARLRTVLKGTVGSLLCLAAACAFVYLFQRVAWFDVGPDPYRDFRLKQLQQEPAGPAKGEPKP
jgi:hypothetical protein